MIASLTTAAVCAASTSVRVPDVDCTAHHAGDTWVYYRARQVVPAVGRATAGSSGEPPAGDALPGVPDDGGSAGT